MADTLDSTTRPRTDPSSSSDDEKLSAPKTNPLRHRRSNAATMGGSKPTKSQDTVELSPLDTVDPPPNTLDRIDQITDADLAGFDDAKSGTPKKGVKDTRNDVHSIRVNDFHHFYWLAAAPTVSTSQDRSPLAGRREQKESISFNLDKRRLRQSVAQMQTYLQKRNKISRQAYAQCPSHSLRMVDHCWAARINEDGVIHEREKDRRLRKQAQADKDRLVAQKIDQLQRIEAEQRLAKQREERQIKEQMHSDDEQLSQRTEVLQKEEGSRLAAGNSGRLGSEELIQKREEETGRRTEPDAKGELSYSDDARRHESPDEHRSGSTSSSAGVSPRSRPDEFSDPIVFTDLADQEAAKTILKLSKQLFAFFFPLAYSSSMTNKYWGAVFWLLHVGTVACGVLPLADMIL